MVKNKEEYQSELKKIIESGIYPIAFLTSVNCLFMKSEKKISADGTPRYIPNPNSDATYCIQDRLKDYTPIYTKKEVKKYQKEDL